MCGIAGVVSPSGITEAHRAAVKRMNDAMVRRGPDDEGFFSDEHVALSMRRLSIIDAAGGHQPLKSRDGNTVLICNGEIYNYIEEQESLARQGHRFSTRSDVETILPLYEQLGAGCVNRLRGMFAFALWDVAKKTLLLARDRFGEKPLYLHRDRAGALWFASEMKALLSGVRFSSQLRLSPEAVNLFLVYQYVPEPLTMFDGVEKLPAGHVLEVSPGLLPKGGGVPRSRPYWNYLEARQRGGNAAELVRAALDDACRITLRSDAPVGVSLSGGIDSSLVAVLARKHCSGPLQAFSVGYEGRPESDERAFALDLARKLDMPFHDVELRTADFVETFPRLIWDMDDPIGDIAAYGYHAVSRLAHEHGVPVLLSGLGADELFWGYEWVRDAVAKNVKRRQKRTALHSLLRWQQADQGPRRRAIFYDSLDWMRVAAPLAQQILSAEALKSAPPEAWMRYFEADDWGDIPLWLMDVQNRTWLVSNCLALSDRVSMAHSVEARIPFLDFELADLVTGLRKNGLNDWSAGHKALLIDAVGDLLPRDLIDRKKRGFTPPVGEWMRAATSRYLHLLRRGSLVRQGVLREETDERVLGTRPLDFQYRAALIEIWARLFFDGETPEAVKALAPAG
jgi:asparagine synthase (glutamine-hydrolysing)